MGSGIVNYDGINEQFAAPGLPTLLLVGPSGMLLADGTQVQFDQKDLEQRKGLTAEQNANAVVFGPSGIVLKTGENIQFGAEDAPPAPHVVLDGPSGTVMSDGTLMQKRAKRHLIGPSAIITDHGELIQLPAGVTVVESGPSGFVLSNGENIQLTKVF